MAATVAAPAFLPFNFQHFSQHHESPKAVQYEVSSAEPFLLEVLPGQYSAIAQLALADNREQLFTSVGSCEPEALDERDNRGNTPLIWATESASEESVRILIAAGALINEQNYLGETALYLASERGYSEVCAALLEHGANTNLATIDGVSPAHIAAAQGNVDVLEQLFRHGAHMDAVDDALDTPLHYAVRESQCEAVAFLVERCRVNTQVCNEDEETPADLADCLDEVAIHQYLVAQQGGRSGDAMQC